ncbi:MAG: solute-binding protein, partial [Oceanospirillales bacterium]|nr:solute-binding protein [Oceanospirillales bacterium]
MSENLVILAPGSMTHILPSLLVEYHSLKPPSIHCEFGPSGSLRAKIEAGKHYHLFLSATTTHTQDLFHSDHLSKHDVLGYNRMVLLHRRSIDVRQETVLSHLVDSTRILGMSTTGLDPAGDYALEILKNVSVATKTSLSDLVARTRIITGGRETPNAPPGRNQYGWIMETQNVDLLLTYYSNALAAMDDNPHVG